jgi:hypothetical protein
VERRQEYLLRATEKDRPANDVCGAKHLRAAERAAAAMRSRRVASLLTPPLPQADRDRLAQLFGHLTGVGMDATPAK